MWLIPKTCCASKMKVANMSCFTFPLVQNIPILGRRDGNGRSKAPATLPPRATLNTNMSAVIRKIPRDAVFVRHRLHLKGILLPKGKRLKPSLLAWRPARLWAGWQHSRQESEEWGIREKPRQTSPDSASTDQNFLKAPDHFPSRSRVSLLETVYQTPRAYLHIHQTHTYRTDRFEMTVSQKPKPLSTWSQARLNI